MSVRKERKITPKTGGGGQVTDFGKVAPKTATRIGCIKIWGGQEGFSNFFVSIYYGGFATF